VFPECNLAPMADVNKDMAATASAMSLPGRAVATPDERALLRRAQKGSQEAYEELVRRHQRRVFAVAYGILRHREDVEDVAQQVFFKAYMSLRRFDMRSAFSTWLYKITVNECLDFLRKRRVRPLVYEADLTEEQAGLLESTLASEGAGANPAQRVLLGDAVENLLSRLSDEDRAILLLKEVEGYSVEEIAHMLSLNTNTVKVRLFRSRGRLMEHWRRQNPADHPRSRREGRP
jgi:RNA polymerase sigma-70 factor, ECF subfamily